MIIKKCPECDYEVDLSNEEFEIILCPFCNSQLKDGN